MEQKMINLTIDNIPVTVPEGTTVLEAARSRSVRHASLLVGPEGDFTDRETAMALEAGFVPVTLGPIVLRVETAAFFGLAAMRYALD